MNYSMVGRTEDRHGLIGRTSMLNAREDGMVACGFLGIFVT